MDTHTSNAQNFIAALTSQIVEIDYQINPLLEKRKAKAALANATAADAGLPAPFPDVGSATPSPAITTDVIAPDQYTGSKMATAVREIMQRRKVRALGPIALDDLYAQLKAGGYAFRAVGKENSVTSLATTLGKNGIFRRVPNSPNLWGLTEWYGSPAKRKTSGTPDDEDDEAESGGNAATPQTASTPTTGVADELP
jgi:hypothetical protein